MIACALRSYEQIRRYIDQNLPTIPSAMRRASEPIDTVKVRIQLCCLLLSNEQISSNFHLVSRPLPSAASLSGEQTSDDVRPSASDVR